MSNESMESILEKIDNLFEDGFLNHMLRWLNSYERRLDELEKKIEALQEANDPKAE